ncbi:hypothetical protein [Xanthomonas cassavae]|uniref:hypothetical protein n=1 Tax=Xanthomonas cassavae TaxID=56450 RepID=UPI001F25E61E|nr:hypothetical protein [Xanthomonas cassavae]
MPLPALFTDEDDPVEIIIFYSKISKVQRQLMLAHFKDGLINAAGKRNTPHPPR